MKAIVRCLASAALIVGLAACATAPADPEERAEFEAINDPLEPLNRNVFAVNMTLDEYVMQPVARGYRDTLPTGVQNSIRNVLNNLKAPYIFVNDVLQAEPDRAAQTMIRFMFNSTAGLGGLFDFVTYTNGPRHHDEDYGQTFAVWGVPAGPYLMLPLLGPSSPRDTAGLVADFFGNPTDLFLAAKDLEWITYSRVGVGALDERSTLLDPLDELKRGSLDFYAAIRSVYRQKRANDIANKDLPVADAYRKK